MRPTHVCARERLYRTCISQRRGRGAAGELSKEGYVHNSRVFCAGSRFDRLALGWCLDTLKPPEGGPLQLLQMIFYRTCSETQNCTAPLGGEVCFPALIAPCTLSANAD